MKIPTRQRQAQTEEFKTPARDSLMGCTKWLFLDMEFIQQATLADGICNLCTHKDKKTFFTQINILMGWSSVDTLIKKHYAKGASATGKPSDSGLNVQ